MQAPNQLNMNNSEFLKTVTPMMTTFGGEMLEKQKSVWNSNFSVFWNSLKIYFAVNNTYVLRKLGIILCPFINKDWTRFSADEAAVSQIQSTHKWALPRDDMNAPDLYIPLMAFTSYILLLAVAKGVGGSGFTPDFLMQAIWRCLLLQFLETFCLMFLIGTKQISAPFLDLFAYTGYKYVGLCVNALMRLLGFYFGLISSLYCSAMLAIFVLRSFRSVVPKTATLGPPRLYIQLACGTLQFLVMLVLCMV